MNRRIILSLIAILCVQSLTLAQKEDSITYNERVVITGSYNPVLRKATKMNVAPVFTDTSSSLQHTFNYTLQPYKLSSIYSPTRIKAARITGEPRTRLYHSYLRLGMGNYWSPQADFYYNSTTSQTFNYGFRIGHQSSWGTIGDKDKPETFYGKNHFSLTDVAMFGKLIIKERTQLIADIAYQNDYNLYYGFSDTILATHNIDRDALNTSDYSATYNNMTVNLGVKNLVATKGIVYDAALHLDNLWAGYGSSELQLAANAMLGYRWQLKNGDFLAAMRVSVNHFGQTADSTLHPLGHISDSMPSWTPDSTFNSRANRLLFNVNPYVETALNGFNIHAGIRLVADNYSHLDQSQLLVYPDISVSHNFLNNALALTLSATGNATPNSWNSIRQLNPYVMPACEVRASKTNEFALQMRYQISKKMEVSAHAAYLLLRDRLSFQTSHEYMLQNVFKTKYEDFNLLELGADFSFINDELLQFSIGGNYYVPSEVESDTLPTLYTALYDAHVNLDMTINEKFLVHTQFLLIGSMQSDYTYDPLTDSYTVSHTPMRYGLNLEFEYRHNKALSFFLKANNLAFQRYLYWKNYPSQRALFILGLTYTIPTK
ncbi:MAG: hypothetical protein KBT04_02825 [Bacteroidales bacterium]|nr:hypothetical protein [Candidatus Colimorpha onthohippi]